MLHLEPSDMPDLVSVMERFSLDFDDAYQNLAATKYHLTLVSFDRDFDRTDKGHTTPGQLM